MRDSDDNKREETGVGEFARDKRRRSRTVSVEAVTRSPRVERGEEGDRPERSENPDHTPRRSYNPNFSADNKFTGGPRPERDFNRWDGPSDRGSDRAPRTYAPKPYGARPQGDGSYPERPRPERPYNTDRPYASRPSWADRPEREERPYGDRPSYNNDRPYAPRPSWGAERPERGERPQRPWGERPAGERPVGGGKPHGPKKKPSGKKGGGMEPGAKPEFYPSYSIPTDKDKELRLNRYIAMSGKCSRREADTLIASGEVTVNGNVVIEMGVKVTANDEIRLRGELLSNERKVYIIINKPKGFVTSIDDPHAEKTVMDIVRNACTERIYPVGRLDKSSVGVLLLTNDGDLTEKLTHPSHNKKKVYQVTLEHPLTNADLQKARDGIDLDDGVIIPDAVDFVKPDNRKEVGIEIHSGRNRIVRRIFEELGYGVHKLDRVYFAGLTKKNLKRGQWRFLTDKEVAMLKSGRYE
ncbi:MAG: pseudouridine synthase [Alistipes sp.]|nr:pseudouridine synthase [Alistipes sp.]